MGALDMPVAEVDVDEELVRSLLRAQHPDLADRVLRPVGFGWDNVVFRLGDDLTVRVPRRTLGAELIEHELRWLPVLAPRLPLPIPAAVRRGAPAEGYPWSWAVCPWMPGTIAALAPPADPDEAARALGAFVAALHEPAPPDAPTSAYRGVPLGDRAEVTEGHLEQLAEVVDAVELRARWRDLMATDPWPGPPRWVHGDLHPANLLVDRGRLSAVIDFGDLCAGDPATDLAVAWMLLPPAARPAFRRAAGVDHDEAAWRRGRGWALALGLACLSSSADHAVVAEIGRRTLDAVLADDATD